MQDNKQEEKLTAQDIERLRKKRGEDPGKMTSYEYAFILFIESGMNAEDAENSKQETLKKYLIELPKADEAKTPKPKPTTT